MAKLNQIIAVSLWRIYGDCALAVLLLTRGALQNYHTKAALIILHARADLPPTFSKGSDSPRVNRWVSQLVGFEEIFTD
jgi:autophagy-related protein 13